MLRLVCVRVYLLFIYACMHINRLLTMITDLEIGRVAEAVEGRRALGRRGALEALICGGGEAGVERPRTTAHITPGSYHSTAPHLDLGPEALRRPRGALSKAHGRDLGVDGERAALLAARESRLGIMSELLREVPGHAEARCDALDDDRCTTQHH